ncbi:MAG: cytochrome c [Geminicoccaceae bacterium]
MRRQLLSVAIAATVLGAVGTTWAEDVKPKGFVAIREATMDAMAAHVGAIKVILTEKPELLSQVAAQANAIAAMGPLIPAMFPAGSLEPPSEALQTVWDKPDDFKKDANELADLATAVAKAAESGDAKATLAAFGQMGKEGCGGCHETFRKKG